MIDYETGPRYFDLMVNLSDNGTTLPGNQVTPVVIRVNILNANDPPWFLSPNFTSVLEYTRFGTPIMNVSYFDQVMFYGYSLTNSAVWNE